MHWEDFTELLKNKLIDLRTQYTSDEVMLSACQHSTPKYTQTLPVFCPLPRPPVFHQLLFLTSPICCFIALSRFNNPSEFSQVLFAPLTLCILSWFTPLLLLPTLITLSPCLIYIYIYNLQVWKVSC